MQFLSLDSKQRKEHKFWKDHFKSKYSFEFLNPTYEKVPFVSKLFEDEKISQKLSQFEYYLLGTYPIDMKTNVHNEMSQIRYKFTKEEYQWHQRHNKLGLNCWGTQAGISLIVLNRVLRRNDLHVIDSFPTDYSKMSFDKKRDLCISVDKKLYALLERLYLDYNFHKV